MIVKEAPKNLTLSGYKIPEGTYIFVSKSVLTLKLYFPHVITLTTYISDASSYNTKPHTYMYRYPTIICNSA